MPISAPDALERARRVRLMIFDVDGVLTDGRLWYGAGGEELKVFHSFDGHGMKMLAASGVACAVLSGRRSGAVAARCGELGVEHVLQGIDDKLPAFEKLRTSLALSAQDCGFMGDEVVDLPVLERCGFACAPPEALAVEAVQIMERHKVNQLLVVDGDGRLAGALNMHDLFRAKVI